MRTTSLTRVLSLTILALLPALSGRAELRAVKTGDTIVDGKALTIQGAFGPCINGKSFQQNPVVTHAGFQYLAYYDADRQVCIARRKLPNGPWETIRFTDYAFKSNDAHNIISMGICPADGTIHVAFDHHGHPLHYRVSKKGAATTPGETAWEPSLFGPVLSEMETGKPIKITYPRFWQTPEGALQFCYRSGGSGNGDRMLVDYDPRQGIWSKTRQIDSGKGVWETSASRCSYPNGYDYGPQGRLHTTWVWREGADTANHDLMYAFSEDQGKTWKNTQGEVLPGPAAVDSPGITAVPIANTLGLMNTHGQAVDSQGRIHVVMWHCTEESLRAAGSAPGETRWGPPEARRYHHYWRSLDGQWIHRELPGVAGNRPKILIDRSDNAILIYGADHHDSSEQFARRNDLHIAAATAASQWTDWKTIYVEEGPFQNEMLADPACWRDEGVLSIMVQEAAAQAHQPTALRVLDFSVAEDTEKAADSKHSPAP